MSTSDNTPAKGAKPTDLMSRVYRHTSCGTETIVSGDHYVMLECPFRPVSSTFCVGCKAFVPLDQVQWVDSGEQIAAYRKRLAATVPFWKRVRLSLLGTAYEGAINLNLDRKGRPLGPPKQPPAA